VTIEAHERHPIRIVRDLLSAWLVRKAEAKNHANAGCSSTTTWMQVTVRASARLVEASRRWRFGLVRFGFAQRILVGVLGCWKHPGAGDCRGSPALALGPPPPRSGDRACLRQKNHRNPGKVVIPRLPRTASGSLGLFERDFRDGFSKLSDIYSRDPRAQAFLNAAIPINTHHSTPQS
jgi:hypothetical protein